MSNKQPWYKRAYGLLGGASIPADIQANSVGSVFRAAYLLNYGKRSLMFSRSDRSDCARELGKCFSNIEFETQTIAATSKLRLFNPLNAAFFLLDTVQVGLETVFPKASGFVEAAFAVVTAPARVINTGINYLLDVPEAVVNSVQFRVRATESVKQAGVLRKPVPSLAPHEEQLTNRLRDSVESTQTSGPAVSTQAQAPTSVQHVRAQTSSLNTQATSAASNQAANAHSNTDAPRKTEVKKVPSYSILSAIAAEFKVVASGLGGCGFFGGSNSGSAPDARHVSPVRSFRS